MLVDIVPHNISGKYISDVMSPPKPAMNLKGVGKLVIQAMHSYRKYVDRLNLNATIPLNRIYYKR